MARRIHVDQIPLSSKVVRRRSKSQSDSGPNDRAEESDAPHWQAAMLRQQRTVGNAAVSRLIEGHRVNSTKSASMGTGPVASSPSKIEELASDAEQQRNQTVAYAGIPLKQDPPGGMKFIASQSTEISLGGKPAGFTGVQSAAAFTQPNFTTRMAVEKDGYKRKYFAVVEPTSTQDVTHRSFYPAPGTHDNAVSKQKDGTYRYFWTISSTISELIKAGEQEHLNDAQRAFDLTYGLIAKEINAMAGQKFGPADSPDAASKLAEDELRRRLPAALGTDPKNWFNVLEQMLSMTQQRDRTHLHDVMPGEAIEKGKTFYIPLVTTPQTRIDHVGSEQIVNYPGAAASGAASERSSTTGSHEHGKDE